MILNLVPALSLSSLGSMFVGVPNAKFVEASDMVDEIKSLKSNEEIALIRAMAAMQDAAMKAAFEALAAGKTDLQVAAVAEYVGHQMGSEQGIYLCASGPVTEPTPIGIRHVQNRTIRKGASLAGRYACVVDWRLAHEEFLAAGPLGCAVAFEPVELVRKCGKGRRGFRFLLGRFLVKRSTERLITSSMSARSS